MARVSVIIPNYNYGRFLEKRIRSVLEQSFQDCEIIYLDDASIDESERVISEFSGDRRLRVVRNARNSGSPFIQWNKGMRTAHGEYVWIAEADDYADERFLESMIRVLDANRNVGIAFCESYVVDEHGNLQDYLLGGNCDHDFIRRGTEECSTGMIETCTIPTASAVLFRRSLCQEVGFADESMLYFGDWLMWVKMLIRSDVAFVSQPLNYYRRHQRSVCMQAGKRLNHLMEMYKVSGYVVKHLSVAPEVYNKTYDKIARTWLRFIYSRRIVWEWRYHIKLYRFAQTIDTRIRQRLFKLLVSEPLWRLGVALPLLKFRDYMRRVLSRVTTPSTL